jgi:PAS domain S-box-containing protein
MVLNKKINKKYDEEHKFRALAEQSSDIILLVNREGNIIYENPAVEKIMGFKIEDRIGRPVFENLHPDDLNFVTGSFHTLLRNQYSPAQNHEIRLRHSNGSWRTFEVVACNLKDSDVSDAVMINLHDVTERKQTEMILREQEERMLGITENLPGVVFQFCAKDNGQYDITYVRKRMEEYFDDLPELKDFFTFFLSRIHEEDRDRYLASIQEAVEKEIPWNFEGRFFAQKTDEMIWFQGLSTPIRHGDQLVFYGILLNITERKRAEEILRKQEERMLGITENLPGFVFQFYVKDNGEYGVNYLRKRMTEYFDEVPDLKDYFQLFLYCIHEEDRDRFLSSIQESVKKEMPWNFEGRFFAKKTGEMIWFQGISTPIRHEDQLVYNGILLNITERKRVEERYRNIFVNAQEGIYQSTPEGRFLLANQSMARMLGYESPQDLIATITDIASQVYTDPDERTEFIRMMKKQGFVRNSEVRFRRKDGSIIWVSRTMQMVRDDKGQILYEGIIEDITQRKESVERLRNALAGTVRAIAAIVETRDPYTAGHQRQAGDLALAIAAEMGLSTDRIEGLRLAAIIHDLGKISVPSEILSKPSELTHLEFELIKTHAHAGHEILKDIEFPWPVARIVFEHHERMDGSGYPKMLKGEDILLEARILAVADVVEAMSSHRPYRASLGIEAALEEIEKNKGILYDAAVVDACQILFRVKGYRITYDEKTNHRNYGNL